MGQQASRVIAASSAEVWAVVSDITRIGERSTETYLCEWDEGQQPGLGATCTGYNRYGEIEWSNRATITEWVPESRLTWDVSLMGPMAERFGTDAVTRWGFVIEPIETGVRLVEATEDMRPDDLRALAVKHLPPEVGADRLQRNYETMEATLDAIAEVCERR